MVPSIYYDRRTDDFCVSSSIVGDVWPDWQDNDERWLFISPHDDDIICGAGLTFLAAIHENVTTHAVVTTNGYMGYCHAEQRETVADVRKKEAEESFATLGLPGENLHFLHFPDGTLRQHAGRKFAGDPPLPSDIAGGAGLQNAYTYILRKTRPTRLFLPSITDLHPDHRIANEEAIISIFHAQGCIWPELGMPIDTLPKIYEYATYSDFLTPPTIRIRVPNELLERKLEGIRQYKSQEQIEMIIDLQRKAGPTEYIREVRFDIMIPGKYDSLFDA